MKIAITGKGGVGKTTIAGIMARALVKKKFKVIAIDADPSTNLGLTLAFSPEALDKIIPISENSKLIEEKTGVRQGSNSPIFRLSFSVNDIIEKYSFPSPDGVFLLVMGTVKNAGEGCICPANALVRSLLRHLIVKRDEIVIVDMVAGIEHLGRGTAKHVDCMLIVVEPNKKSVEVAKKIFKLASDLRIPNIFIIGNKISSDNDKKIIQQYYGNTDQILSFIPYDDNIKKADAVGNWLTDLDKNSKGIKKIWALSETLLEKKQYNQTK